MEEGLSEIGRGPGRVWIPAWAWLASAMLIGLLLFLPLLTAQAPFLCDDYTVIATNIADGKLSLERMLHQFVATPPGVSDRYYRPIFYLSFAFDFWIAQSSPWFYYLMNIVFHVLTAWLLFMLLRYLNANQLWSVLSMWIFLCHPIHIETVAWISARSSSLAALFTLAALTCFARYRRAPHPAALAGLIIFFGLGLLAREVVVIVPGLMLMIDLFVRRSPDETVKRPSSSGIAKTLAPYLPVVLAAVVYLFARGAALGSAASGYGDLFKELAQTQRIGQILTGLSRYFVPCMETLTGGLALWQELIIALPSAVLLLSGLGRLRSRTTRGLCLTALCLFGFSTLPGLPILQVNMDLMNSRMFYLPSAGLSVLLAGGALALGSGRAGSRANRLLQAVRIISLAAVILGGAALLVFNQQAVREAGKTASSFLAQVRSAGVRLLVVPRTAFFPYADQDGDGIKNDELAYFAPLEEAPLAHDLQPSEAEDDTALLINVPRVVRGVYVFWGSLDTALLPLFGDPGIEVLFTEMSPKLHPEGSFFGPLLQDGVSLLKWDGRRLVRARAEKVASESEAGRDLELASAATLGTLDLLSDAQFPAEAFKPVMTLPATTDSACTYRYRALTPFGASKINARPRTEGDRLVFDPYHEPEAGPIFQALGTLSPNPAAAFPSHHGLLSIPCILFIERLSEGRVQARTRHLRLRINFNR